MKVPNAILSKLIRAAGAIACTALAGWISVSGLYPMIRRLISEPLSFATVLELGFGIVVLAILVGLLWLAWRLWRVWNVSTVRLFVGVCLAMFLIWADMLPMRWMNNSGSQLPDQISSIGTVPLLVFGAFAYRYFTKAMIRVAGLVDQLDIYGQPIGHQWRIRNFAALLGWTIFFAGMSVDQVDHLSDGPGPPTWITGCAVFGPILLGYVVYKLIVRYSKPRTQPSLPPGGFEVIANASPMANVIKEAI